MQFLVTVCNLAVFSTYSLIVPSTRLTYNILTLFVVKLVISAIILSPKCLFND